ncbi:MAG TPA: aspartate dehydrogenase, partial [Paracoccaceae bacterium]|nr:aspartate dehydrogenase [Paracoccaceae bacterium]
MITVGICGLGAIGMKVARALDAGAVEGVRLAAVSARDLEGARARLAGFAAAPQVVPAERLPELADVVVECSPAAVFETVARATVEAGRIL